METDSQEEAATSTSILSKRDKKAKKKIKVEKSTTVRGLEVDIKGSKNTKNKSAKKIFNLTNSASGIRSNKPSKNTEEKKRKWSEEDDIEELLSPIVVIESFKKKKGRDAFNKSIFNGDTKNKTNGLRNEIDDYYENYIDSIRKSKGKSKIQNKKSGKILTNKTKKRKRYISTDEDSDDISSLSDINSSDSEDDETSMTKMVASVVINNTNNKYQEHPTLASLPQSTIDEFFSTNVIQVVGDSTLKPIMSFEQLMVDKEIKRVLTRFDKPTPIQATCWPLCLSGKDVIGIAETGSGKTLAFIVPAVIHIKSPPYSPPNHQPYALVLAPTRELAIQTQQQCEMFGSTCGIKSVCVYGGVSKGEQRRLLRKGVHIVVATPGRLLDLTNDGVCDISNVKYLVLDEADRMLDTGFEEEVRNIILKTREDRQTVMFSATWPESVRKLANDFLTNPIRVTIGSQTLTTNRNVTQIVEVIDDPSEKDRRLVTLLEKYHNRKNRVLIFVLYKKEASRVENMLARKGYEAQSIHGDKSQFQRIEALNAFRDGIYPLLIATDVASRGLDIPDVRYVINYTFPLTIEDYVHRIGRTGRAGNKGISHTLFTSCDKVHSGELIKILRQSNQQIPDSLLRFGTGIKKKEHKAYGAFYKEIDHNVKPTKIKFED
ncbi:29935_t:CDS:2 [Gigaspora margarita]|uniref:RNA helicase n=1 Tax=Gigaspora margarita TaxID=4874 RepID=A0ABN7VW94_GIGMA|nr:29935_t:CDS:2 [Gigaspora margarita]